MIMGPWPENQDLNHSSPGRPWAKMTKTSVSPCVKQAEYHPYDRTDVRIRRNAY